MSEDRVGRLITWLRGQLDEDERRGEWLRLHSTPELSEWWSANLASKRAVLDLADRYIEAGKFERLSAIADHYAKVVRALAAAYSDHPGYREEWRP